MTDPTPQSLLLVLADGPAAGRIAVDLEAFFEFTDQMDGEVEKLVRRWAHAAAPQAARSWRNCLRKVPDRGRYDPFG